MLLDKQEVKMSGVIAKVISKKETCGTHRSVMSL